MGKIFTLKQSEGSGYNNNMTARYSSEGQLINSSSCAPLEPASFTQHDQQVSHGNQIQNATYDNSVGLALGLPHSSSFRVGDGSLLQAGLNPFDGWSGLNPFDGWSGIQEKGVDDFLSEEELRMRSLQMLENEDVQHLLRLFSMGGHASVNVPDVYCSFPSYIPSESPGFSHDKGPPRSWKAVAGWLKIKAAMRWGIFVRKKAAERRARIVELEDELRSF